MIERISERDKELLRGLMRVKTYDELEYYVRTLTVYEQMRVDSMIKIIELERMEANVNLTYPKMISELDRIFYGK